MDNQYEAYRQVTRYFTQGLFRLGAGLALAPLSVLPKQSQEQFKEASQDFTNGLAKLAHTVGNTLDTLTK